MLTAVLTGVLTACCVCPAGVYNPKKLLGVTTLDVVRANTFVAQVSTHSHPNPCLGRCVEYPGLPYCNTVLAGSLCTCGGVSPHAALGLWQDLGCSCGRAVLGLLLRRVATPALLPYASALDCTTCTALITVQHLTQICNCIEPQELDNHSWQSTDPCVPAAVVLLLFSPQAKGLDLKEVDVPVVGGHAGVTILPLLSQVSSFWVEVQARV